MNKKIQVLKIIDHYYLNQSEVLGQGAFSVVYKGIDKQTGKEVAVKTIKLNEQSSLYEHANKEIKLLQLIDHDNVVRLYDVKRSANNIYLIMEFCNDISLERLLTKNQGRLVENDAVKIFKDIVNGMKCLSENLIVHRDLKPANILIHNFQAKIADFGFSKLFNYSQEETEIINKQLNFPDTPIVSHLTKDLLQMMLTVNETQRIGWDSVFDHPLITERLEDRLKTSLEQYSQLDNGDSLRKSKEIVKLFFQQNKIVSTSVECLQRDKINRLIVKDHLKFAEITSEFDTIISRLENTNISLYSDNQDQSQNSAAIIFEMHRTQLEYLQLFNDISSQLLFRRNKAIFFYLTAIQINDLYFEQHELNTIDKEFILRSIFLLLKYSVSKLFKLYKTLKNNEVFIVISNQIRQGNKQWELYLKSEQRTNLLNFISFDFEMSQLFFDMFLQYTKAYLNKVMQESVQTNDLFSHQNSNILSEMENEQSLEQIGLLSPPNILTQQQNTDFFQKSQTTFISIEQQQMIESFLNHCNKRVKSKEVFTHILSSTIQLLVLRLPVLKEPTQRVLLTFMQAKFVCEDWKGYIKNNKQQKDIYFWSKFCQSLESQNKEQLYLRLIGHQ